jgi:hypothetical protein
MLARIQEWQEGNGRREAVRRLDGAHKLLNEVASVLTKIRREMLGGGNRLQ